MKTKAFITAFAMTALSAGAFAANVFAYDIRTNRFITFDSATPLTQTVLGTATPNTIRGMDFDTSGNLWAVASPAAGTNSLNGVNMSNGTFASTLAITGLLSTESVSGLTITTGGTAFLSAGQNLYTLNLGTGAATLIGGFGSANLFVDIAADNAGNLFATDISTDQLWSINSGTGVATAIGALGFNINFAQGMDFDQSTNTLLATLYTGGGTGQFASINTVTGAATSIAATTPTNGEYEMAVVNAVPEPMTMLVLAGAAAVAARRRKSSK